MIFISQEAPFLPLSNDVNPFKNEETEEDKIEKITLKEYLKRFNKRLPRFQQSAKIDKKIPIVL